MDTWILIVLVVIAVEIIWRRSGDSAVVELGRELKGVVGLLQELKEELQWLKDDNFAAHLLRKGGDTFATHLFEEMEKNREDLGLKLSEIDETLMRELSEINETLHKIAGRLHEPNEIVSALQEAGGRG